MAPPLHPSQHPLPSSCLPRSPGTLFTAENSLRVIQPVQLPEHTQEGWQDGSVNKDFLWTRSHCVVQKQIPESRWHHAAASGGQDWPRRALPGDSLLCLFLGVTLSQALVLLRRWTLRHDLHHSEEHVTSFCTQVSQGVVLGETWNISQTPCF